MDEETLARLAREHLYDEGVKAPAQGSQVAGDRAAGADWQDRLGRAIARTVLDALSEHTNRYVHLKGN